MNIEDALQMCSAPSLDFTGGEWCYAANSLAEEVERLRAQLHAANRVTAALDDTDPWDAIRQAIYMGDRGQDCVCSEQGGKCYMHAQQERAEAALDAVRSQIEDRDALEADLDRYRSAIGTSANMRVAAEARCEQLAQALREPCAECGHIDWRELA